MPHKILIDMNKDTDIVSTILSLHKEILGSDLSLICKLYEQSRRDQGIEFNFSEQEIIVTLKPCILIALKIRQWEEDAPESCVNELKNQIAFANAGIEWSKGNLLNKEKYCVYEANGHEFDGFSSNYLWHKLIRLQSSILIEFSQILLSEIHEKYFDELYKPNYRQVALFNRYLLIVNQGEGLTKSNALEKLYEWGLNGSGESLYKKYRTTLTDWQRISHKNAYDDIERVVKMLTKYPAAKNIAENELLEVIKYRDHL